MLRRSVVARLVGLALGRGGLTLFSPVDLWV
jgi:hypothetical protein